jgi:ATP-dependent DNA ligase
MPLPLTNDYPPMEADLATDLPEGEAWVYEPKWDGFRCLLFRDGDEIDLRSKSGKPLGRYFPDVVASAAALKAKRFVLDGEIVISVDGALVFDELLLRIHPAESRVRALAAGHPAHLILFDLLVDARGTDRTPQPLARRRQALESFARTHLGGRDDLHLSPQTDDVALARAWLKGEHGGLDGVMAKRADLPYAAGERTAMRKIKRLRSADCVVGGFRFAKGGKGIGSLLLGLYGEDGALDHVGFCSAMSAGVRREAAERLLPLRGGDGFTGKAPGGPSRWRKEGSGDWEPVRPELVVEVRYDHFTGGRFRHGTKFLRWRPDKDPAACRRAQVEREERAAPALL